MTIGDQLLALKARSGFSLEQIAKRAGYQGRSGVQRYFSPDFDRRLDPDVAVRLSEAFSGYGEPPIGTLEVLALVGSEFRNEARPAVQELAPRYMDLPRDVPVYGTGIGTFNDGTSGELIEQTTVYKGEAIDYFQRPPGVAHKQGIYGIYVSGSSQSPRFEDGEIAFVDPNRPPSVGDDVVVYLSDADGDGEKLIAVLVKRLLRRTAVYIELKQFNPPMEFRVEAARVSAIHRILTNTEMLASGR